MGEEKRQEMMQNLFGESDEEVDSDQEAVRPSAYLSDEEGEGEVEGEGQAEIEGEGEAESEGERADSEPEKEESEGERYRSSPEREISDQRMESDVKEAEEAESDAEEYDRREATSRRHAVSPSVSERSGEHKGLEDGDEEVEQVREASEQGDDANVLRTTANMHDVFGESDDEEAQEYAGQHSPERSEGRAASEDEGSEQRGLRPEDMIPDEEEHYESEEEHQFDQKQKEKPVGPPLHLEVPLCPPPGLPEKMNIVRVSNIMGIEPKPFDPKTFVEEEVFMTDESGTKKRIRLEDNVVRWREVRNRNGSVTCESNARFVRWSDGSLQLLIGNEVLDISVQNARNDNVHLFLRHLKGILQSQGRLQQKMRFMPSSLSSKSHRLLTALVDSQHKKSYKVKNVITNTDPEREKEEKEKALEQRIRSREDLHRKQEKISRKYAPVREREPQLSPGYLEEALEEEDEADGYPENRRAAHTRRFQEELEAEGRAERRIINAKKQQPPARERPSKYSKDRRPMRPSRHEAEEAMSDESEREVSEYESDGLDDEEENVQEDMEEEEPEEEEPEEQEEEEQEAQEDEEGESEEEDSRHKRKLQDREESPLEESPPRKPAQRRRVVVSESDED
uniref:TSA: Wollemia nobilis Ref_Wollemi_Transcript_9075_2392 transcribed RNA sequence n=1 Tax=Wollemia nobilis TaxID=56998 RepID=A0A0C9RWC4_9CONI